MEVYENPRLSESAKVKQIEKTLTHDMKDAYLGCKDVMDLSLIHILLLAMWCFVKIRRCNNESGR